MLSKIQDETECGNLEILPEMTHPTAAVLAANTNEYVMCSF